MLACLQRTSYLLPAASPLYRSLLPPTVGYADPVLATLVVSVTSLACAARCPPALKGMQIRSIVSRADLQPYIFRSPIACAARLSPACSACRSTASTVTLLPRVRCTLRPPACATRCSLALHGTLINSVGDMLMRSTVRRVVTHCPQCVCCTVM